MAKTLNDLTPADAKRHRLLGSRILRAYPASPLQVELQAKMKTLKIELGLV